MGIERFIARRGTPSKIWSDNGTNFVGAEKELLACIKSWNGMAPTIFAHKGVTWKFNPPGAPHHGGSWERLIRSVKRVLNDILGSRRVTEEVLGTTLCLVEQAFKSRPITPVITDSRECDLLSNTDFSKNYEWSRAICDPLENSDTEVAETEQTLINRNIKTEKQNITLSKEAKIMKNCSSKKELTIDLASQKGASNCLSVLSLKIRFLSQQIRV